MYSSADEQAERASTQAYEAKRRQDPNAPQEDAMLWFCAQANSLTTRLRICFEDAPSRGLMYREAAAYAAKLSDLSLYAEEAQSGRMKWTDAKAAFLFAEADAATPAIKIKGDLSPVPLRVGEDVVVPMRKGVV